MVMVYIYGYMVKVMRLFSFSLVFTFQLSSVSPINISRSKPFVSLHVPTIVVTNEYTDPHYDCNARHYIILSILILRVKIMLTHLLLKITIPL